MSNPLKEPTDARTRIVEATLKLVAREGRQNFSMLDVCKLAQVSRTTLYRHFPDKEAIVASLFDEVTASFEKGMRAAIADNPNAAERLQVVTAYMRRYFEERRLHSLQTADPVFVLDLLNRSARINHLFYEEVLAPYFNIVETALGVVVDRALISYVLNNLLAAMIFMNQPAPCELDLLLQKVVTSLALRSPAPALRDERPR